ncbi:DUF4097 family beta strand repeat-containing protein [Streptomyces sp. E11-3]|uniref:DUF4097 family beta strand repeat-containing protein n=1 Tax=Streptomyces sp. E11-3 TaxID=3110112 RepID=UPI00397E967B
MPDFDTPNPITVTVHAELGAIRITAEDRADTVVHVHPSSQAKAADVKAAEQTRVEYSDGRLLVRTPKGRALFGKPGSVLVEIALPSGSRLQGTAELADFTCAGRLGECRVKTGVGDIRVERADTVQLVTQYGDVSLDRAAGDATVSTGSGEVRIGEVDGTAEIKNSNGSTQVGEVIGELRLKAANGKVFVGRAHTAVTLKSANGDVRVDEVIRGTADLATGAGDMEIGIREGTAAWLDVNSRAGSVRSTLEAADGPGESEETVEVRARTGLGDIVIHRAAPQK